MDHSPPSSSSSGRQQQQQHVLGGGDGNHINLTPDEIRRRRLAALGGGGGGDSSGTTTNNSGGTTPSPGTTSTPLPRQQQQQRGSSTTTTTPQPSSSPKKVSSMNNSSNNMKDDGLQGLMVLQQQQRQHQEDDDEDLQAALALSLQDHQQPKHPQSKIKQQQEPQQKQPPPILIGENNKGGDGCDGSTIRIEDYEQQQQQNSVPLDNAEEEEEEEDLDLAEEDNDNDVMIRIDMIGPFDVASFHGVMWDSGLTTDNDKLRWVGQGIDVRRDDADDSRYMMTDAATGTNSPSPNTKESRRTILEKIAEKHLPWGLLQEHGGPCGVLAAVQAEMLRKLINTSSSLEPSTGSLDPIAVREAMAHAVALILARAALTDPASSSSSSSSSPTTTTTTSAASPDDGDPKRCVHIVLPAPNRNQENQENNVDGISSVQPLTWDDLEPWTTSESSSSTNTVGGGMTTTTSSSSSTTVLSPTLLVYRISVPPETAIIGGAGGPKRQKTQRETSGSDNSNHNNNNNESFESRIRRLTRVVRKFLLASTDSSASSSATSPSSSLSSSSTPLDHFRKSGGVMLLVMSLVACRTRDIIQKEFDDTTGTRLTSQFGHCSQELINLLLTGQAVSNVFDNTLTPSGEMVCYGIQSRSNIGYLSQLESLRYVEVGSYYKSPRTPIWVVGSTSHFTVLFGESSSLSESKSDMLLEQCRRAFKSVEGGEENGFIATDQLGMVFKRLDLDNNISDAAVMTLGASLEVTGSGIILWDDFWKTTSRLMTGATVETILQEEGDNKVPTEIINVVDGGDVATTTTPPPPPLLGTSSHHHQFDPSSPMKPPAIIEHPANLGSAEPPFETDEEMARRLQQEWEYQSDHNHASTSTAAAAAAAAGEETGGGGGGGGMTALSEAARVASPMDVDAVATDEEIARKLQAEWDAEIAGVNLGAGGGGGGGGGSGNSVGAVNGSPATEVASDTDDVGGGIGGSFRSVHPVGDDVEGKPPSTTAAMIEDEQMPQALDFEKYGSTFTMYHYNGLRGGVLTPFRITRLSSEEAVGASIALNRGAGSAQSQNGSGDLEDVLRTKWPSCMINWLGKSPPYID